MAKQVSRLSAVAVKNAKTKGLYPDGANLYLQVSSSGAKSWIFRYMLHGKAKAMGLGPTHTISLAEARALAADCRRQIWKGDDPLALRKAEQNKAQLEAARSMTFQQCGEAYIETHKAGWKNAKHAWQWENSLTNYVYPTMGKLPVQDIDVALIMKVLEPIWKTITETATRVRGRIESILDWATVHQYRQGENPARWKGHLENLLPRPSKVQKLQHYPALPHAEIRAFLTKLNKGYPGTAAKALQLLILTATRSSEVRGARWKEFDLKDAVWTVPAERIKMGKEHRIPLSKDALNILAPLHHAHIEEKGSSQTQLVFESQRKGKPLSDMALLMLLRRMKRDDLTVHGFRSTFRDWAAEKTDYAREIAEAALSHAIENKVEAAYRRTDLFDKRRLMMEEWSAYCFSSTKKK